MILPRAVSNIFLALPPDTRMFAFRRVVLQAAGISVGELTRVASGLKVYGRGRVAIGNSCWIGLSTKLFLGIDTAIIIGDRCDIAPEVVFHSGTHEIGGVYRRAGLGVGANICVDDGCWIGARSTILAGARLGAGTIVAAGSVVLGKSYPPGYLIAGVPAKPVRKLDV
jgi:acetyltransferase-like isoleucine patch superfamily enzyme